MVAAPGGVTVGADCAHDGGVAAKRAAVEEREIVGDNLDLSTVAWQDAGNRHVSQLLVVRDSGSSLAEYLRPRSLERSSSALQEASMRTRREVVALGVDDFPARGSWTTQRKERQW